MKKTKLPLYSIFRIEEDTAKEVYVFTTKEEAKKVLDSFGKMRKFYKIRRTKNE